MEQPPRCVFIANGEIHASQVRAFLEAAGIPTAVRGESLRQTHGLTIDGLGAVEILVADAHGERARSLLGAAEAGQFRLGNDVATEGGPPPPDVND
jgi:hypothetical protein